MNSVNFTRIIGLFGKTLSLAIFQFLSRSHEIVADNSFEGKSRENISLVITYLLPVCES
jgi:hypothetical protein